MAETYTFQAEIQQLLNILVHSLYTEREIFLRELISNSSDALNRVQFEMITNRDVLDADAELYIEVKGDKDAGTLTISDSGIGMTQDEMVANLGTIARSGAKAFIDALKDRPEGTSPQDVIGQFGVGFYSVFMVADKVRVVSRSYQKDSEAFAWESDGSDSYTIEPAERDSRGTDIIITLKDDAKEFAESWQLKQVIRRHSDYIAFPIYVDGEEEPTNKQTAIWRKSPSEVEDEQYKDFYRMMTLDFNEPLHVIHQRAEGAMLYYALLFIPGSAERSVLSPRQEPGLKLYARKVLIEEYNTDLLPDYLQFVQGVVDSEDIPLSVSRESVQATRVIANLRNALTNKVLSELKTISRKDPETYAEIFHQFGRFIKQGVAVAPGDKERILPLLQFPSTHTDDPDDYVSLSDYTGRMVSGQDEIYYILADDVHSARRSPHLDAFRQRGVEVLYFTDPVDTVMLMGLDEFEGHQLRAVDDADVDLRDVGEVQADAEEEPRDSLPEDDFGAVRSRFERVLGGRVNGVRESKTLVKGAARLVSDDGSAQRNMFRIDRLLNREYELPVKTLELNPRHPLLHNLSQMVASTPDNPVIDAVVEQVFETALLQDGIHPDPASMAPRLQLLMQAATGTAVSELDFEDVRMSPMANGEVDEVEGVVEGSVMTGDDSDNPEEGEIDRHQSVDPTE